MMSRAMTRAQFSRANCALFVVGAVLTASAEHKPGQICDASDLPTAETLIAECIRAMGGRDALERVASGNAAVHSETPAGTYDINIAWRIDGHVIMEMDSEAGTLIFGAADNIAWTKTPHDGWRAYRGAEAKAVRSQAAEFCAPFDLPQHMLTTWGGKPGDVSLTTFGGRDGYRLELSGTRVALRAVFFDPTTHLLVGAESERYGFSLDEKITVLTRFLDYREVQGVRTFTLARIEQGEIGTTEMRFESLAFNNVDPKRFAVPVEVTAILEGVGQNGSETASDGGI